MRSETIRGKIRSGEWHNPNGRDWTPEEIALLGTDLDELVGQRLGRTKGAVSGKRHALGIAAFVGRGQGQGGRPKKPDAQLDLGL